MRVCFKAVSTVLAMGALAAFCVPGGGQTAVPIHPQPEPQARPIAEGPPLKSLPLNFVGVPTVKQINPTDTYREKPINFAERRAAFSPEAKTTSAIALPSADQMTEQDRLLFADAEGTIAERARFANFALNEGKWSYSQIVCPALPNHLFLRFTRNNGAGDVSVFSASIPRLAGSGGSDKVRLIPILRRSYSLWSPAPVNAMTIAAFNRIRAEESANLAHPADPDWLGTGLCYAALAGANPQLASARNPDGTQQFPAAQLPNLQIQSDGGAVIQFVDLAPKPAPQNPAFTEWSMTFDLKGRLLKAAHTPAPLIREKPIQPGVVNLAGKPL